MAKKKKEKPRREFTRRQLSHWQQQKRRQRIILGLGILVIVAVLGVIGAAWYINEYQPRHQTVITVNDTKFNMDYYLKMLELYGGGQSASYTYSLAEEVVRFIEQNELIRQAALELGISVSNDEVKERLKSNDPPLSNDYRDLVRAELLINKLRDEHFEQKVPMLAEQRHVMAMFLESESQATEVRARLESGEDFAELAGELSLEGFSKGSEGDLGWHPKDILTMQFGSPILGEYAFSSEVGVLSQPIYDETKTKNVGYWLIKVLERKEESEEAHIQAMLLGSEDEAWEVRGRLEAGENFAALAEELSQHDVSKEDGGDLGWLTSDIMSSAFGEFFSEFAFDPEVELDMLSEPMRDDMAITTGGYWLIKVVAMENNRRIEDDDRDWLKARALSEWVDTLWDDPENKVDDSYLDDEKRAWAIQKVAGS